MSDTTFDRLRGNVLDRFDRAERNFKLSLLCGAFVEAAFLVGFLLLADFGERLHVLLLISTVAVYSLMVVGLFALGAHVNKATRLVLQAVDSLAGKR